MGTRVERTHVAVAGLRLAECGTNGAGSLSTSRPCNPTFAQINREGWTRVAESGAGRAMGSTPGPTFTHRWAGRTAGSKADCATQGSSSGK